MGESVAAADRAVEEETEAGADAAFPATGILRALPTDAMGLTAETEIPEEMEAMDEEVQEGVTEEMVRLGILEKLRSRNRMY